MPETTSGNPNSVRIVLVLAGGALFFAGGVLLPLLHGAGLVLTWGPLLLLIVAVRRGHDRTPGAVAARLLGTPAALPALLVLTSVLVVAGGSELMAQALTRFFGVGLWSPMRTALPAGTEDWRLAHMTADADFESDPVLLWRPVDRPPYNAQRFKGPIAETPKPPDVFRVMAYGDSNTDGPRTGGWPSRLGERLARTAAPDGRRFEVINAGVAGYSSYQGLLRFRQEVAVYTPDLVLVSFGWNDLADALGRPDRDFEPPPWYWLAAQRLWLRFRFYRLLRQWTVRPVTERTGPRVPREDYVENLRQFRSLAAERGAEVLLLTRPARGTAADLRRLAPDWRAKVPDYNRALRRLATDEGFALVDVQRWFAKHHPDAFVDECHFTLEGHQLMAEVLSDYLSRR